MISLQQLAKALGGEVSGDGVLCPGPGHSADDRSLSIKLDDKDPDGFVVNSFSPADKWEDCRDHVREKLGLPKWEPKKKAKKSSGAGKPFSRITARYVYRQADGTPYLQVCRKADKTFFQNHWNGQLWVAGKPEGAPIPYRLPELKAATSTTAVHITEGEKDADALAALGFVATTNAGGAGNWTDELNEYFRDRHVYIHEDNDAPGRKRAQHIAAVLDPIAASVRVIQLPGLPSKGDVSDWLEDDPSGARLVKHCERTPVWQPTLAADADKAVDGGDEDDDAALDEGPRKQADILIKLAGAATLFHTPDGIGYAKINVDGHNENWPLRSKGFKRWLSRAFYNEAQGAPNSEAMNAALGVLDARAQFDAPESEAYIRVAGHDGCIYIDLADKDWRAIEIDADGWRASSTIHRFGFGAAPACCHCRSR
jgi:Toprim domain-containing protein